MPKQSLSFISNNFFLILVKGRRIEIVFKCNENIPPEKTKPEFLIEEKNDSNVAYFEVATSVVCIPRMTSCEVI